ncbi:cytochrome P450 4C1-like [Leptidea sinapis]|uniref:cytochrome P450 4C1-like n=1 Tax=Leptidea sinapis TaxID=189913 RepID=UPI0021C45DBA|nr:cytochrome P450 4C1-like [Leptidea sinapis]
MAALTVLLVTSLLIVGLWLRWRVKNKRLLYLASKLPGPPLVPFLGNAWTFMCRSEDVAGVTQNIISQYGEILRFWLGSQLNVVVSKPDDVKILLTSGKTSFKGPQYKYMAQILGGGLLSGSGTKWRRHRKLATPNYTKNAVEGYTDIFNKEAYNLVKYLKTDSVMNIYEDIVKTTTYTVCQTVMGLSKEESLKLPHLQMIIDESPRIYDTIFQRMTKWYLNIYPYYWFTECYRIQKNFIKIMNEFCLGIVKYREESLSKQENNSVRSHISVVDLFLLSQELNEEELIQEIFTLFTASQEASAKICSFLCLMMAMHPECQERLYEEIQMVIGEMDRPITDEDLKRMPYLDMAYKEVLRLFPIGAMLQRTVKEDIAISSHVIPAGSALVIPIYHLQRDRKFWKNPEDFDPDRFSPENTLSRHPLCYLPFSLGPMDCLGRHFGTKLVKTIAVHVFRKFKLSTKLNYEEMRLAIRISVASMDGYPVTLSLR